MNEVGKCLKIRTQARNITKVQNIVGVMLLKTPTLVQIWSGDEQQEVLWIFKSDLSASLVGRNPRSIGRDCKSALICLFSYRAQP